MYQQTKPRNAFKESHTIIKKVLSQRYKHFSVSGKQSLWLHHINKLKNRIHMIILTDTGKRKKKTTFDKTQHPFLIKTLQNVVVESIYLNKISGIYDKLTANVILKTEKLKTFSILSRTRQEGSFLILMFQCWKSQLQHSEKKNEEKIQKQKGSSQIVTV